MAVARRGGTVRVPDIYAGFIHGFLVGDTFDKSLTFRGEQTLLHGHLSQLVDLIGNEKLNPQVIVCHQLGHQLGLAQAVQGYEMFDLKQGDGCTVVLASGR